MTFAELFEFVELHEIDWNSQIYYQRIEDYYFDISDWPKIENDDGEFVKVESPIYYPDDEKIYLSAHY